MKVNIMIRYGELSIKGKNKKRFTKILAHNIKETLADLPEIHINREYDYMFIELNGADEAIVVDRLKNVFGIQSYSPAYIIERDFEILKQTAKEMLMKKFAQEQLTTFKVATSRSDRMYEMDTNDINRELGQYILEEFPHLKVQVKNPDLIVRVKVRNDNFVLSTDWIHGTGGLPVGSSAPAVLMLSGGIDSPVAGYLAMKRGIRVTAIHFSSPPYTSPQALQKTKDLTHKLTRFGGWMNFVEVPFTETQEAIKEHIPEAYLMTITRRMMMRIADRLREQFNGLAIINGESIGQVASQTLESMYAINAVTNTPILRPVVTMDKEEIIDIAKAIDTFELSIEPFEDCCTVFAPPSPKTRPRISKCEYYEQRLDIEGLIERAVANIKFERIKTQKTSQDELAAKFVGLL